VSAVATGRREATKRANRGAILDAARDVFGELGFGAASIRDIVRRTDLATGTFYNYFPDKESVLRALAADISDEARVRVHHARTAADSAETFLEAGFRAYFSFIASDPATAALMRRNAGTIRALFGDPALGAGVLELAADLRAGIAAGLFPEHDTALMAAAMVGAGVEVGVRMLEDEPPDVDGATAFVAALFAAALRPPPV
jgi:AcrR family transcriptional regulator